MFCHLQHPSNIAFNGYFQSGACFVLPPVILRRNRLGQLRSLESFLGPAKILGHGLCRKRYEGARIPNRGIPGRSFPTKTPVNHPPVQRTVKVPVRDFFRGHRIRALGTSRPAKNSPGARTRSFTFRLFRRNPEPNCAVNPRLNFIRSEVHRLISVIALNR